MRVDFRRVYATLLSDWLGVSPRAAVSNDFGSPSFFKG